jgi:RNA polymerase sigma-70 factor (ECF subfamily)
MALPTKGRDEDAGLMAAFLSKDSQAARTLYERYAPRIFGLGRVLLRDSSAAEDLVQDTFLKVWRKGSSFDPGRAPLDVWVLMIARSIAIDVLRRRGLEARDLASRVRPSEASEEPGPEVLAERRDMMDRAREALDKLPPQQRSAVELVYFGDRSSTQVAATQGIPHGTAKSRIRAGIATLREVLREGDDEPSRPRDGSDRSACVGCST